MGILGEGERGREGYGCMGRRNAAKGGRGRDEKAQVWGRQMQRKAEGIWIQNKNL